MRFYARPQRWSIATEMKKGDLNVTTYYLAVIENINPDQLSKQREIEDREFGPSEEEEGFRIGPVLD